MTDDPNDPSTTPPEIVGRIVPALEGEGPPMFESIDRHQDHRVYSIGVPNVRPCDHAGATFILDEKWHTVTCSKCQQPVPAFAVLLVFKDWQDRWRSDRWQAERAQTDLHAARLRYLLKLKGLTDAERSELDTAYKNRGRLKPRELGKIIDQVESALDERRWARARKRDPVKGHLPPTTVYGGNS